MSAITLLGTPAEIYQNGTQYITLVASYPFVMWSTTAIYLPVFYKLGVSTSYEVSTSHLRKAAQQLVGETLALGHKMISKNILLFILAVHNC